LKNKKIITVVSIAAILGGLGTTAQADTAGSESLKTPNSNEIGVTISQYEYKEPSLGVSLKAINWGVEYFGSRRINNDWFFIGGVDYNNGKQDYSSPGSGTLGGVPTYYVNAKLAIGRDFTFDNYVLSPYVGYGYRYLQQNQAGLASSTGAIAYDRQSTYNYAPIGVIHRFQIDSKAKLVSTLEYDYLIKGSQFSGLSVLNGRAGVAGVPDVTNNQSSGYGVNFSVMYKTDTWAVGPYYKYWNINQSDSVSATVTIGLRRFTGTVFEPANNTNEYGVKATYSF